MFQLFLQHSIFVSPKVMPPFQSQNIRTLLTDPHAFPCCLFPLHFIATLFKRDHEIRLSVEHRSFKIGVISELEFHCWCQKMLIFIFVYPISIFSSHLKEHNNYLGSMYNNSTLSPWQNQSTTEISIETIS